MFKPTKKDLQQPVTVGDFVEFTDFVIGNVAMKTDLAQVESRLTDKIYTSQDKVMKKLDIVLTELSATSGNADQYRDEVKDHEERIKHLEAHSGIA
ncbi:MAG: hypothetical protein HYT31_01595 [Parcubacteria group bacterium]|nr:hypothetical protein [Parcubacteria group bacterium]